jgi:hypothetical protein
LRSRYQRGSRAGARTEAPDRQRRDIRAGRDPVSGGPDALSEARDVESELGGVNVNAFFLRGEQIEQQSREPTGTQKPCDPAIPRTEATAPATVRKEHQPVGGYRDAQIRVERHGVDWYFDGLDRFARPVCCGVRHSVLESLARSASNHRSSDFRNTGIHDRWQAMVSWREQRFQCEILSGRRRNIPRSALGSHHIDPGEFQLFSRLERPALA